MIILCSKFEVSMFTHYEHMKGDEKWRNWGGLEGKIRSLGPHDHQQRSHLIECI